MGFPQRFRPKPRETNELPCRESAASQLLTSMRRAELEAPLSPESPLSTHTGQLSADMQNSDTEDAPAMAPDSQRELPRKRKRQRVRNAPKGIQGFQAMRPELLA
ncbi:uncharacterized protein LOC142574450 [Dermacentor variabilis]|uniref:uncharacterized protein LOC142574450 n=1 Tax=Dermacentor variabilis TaxID=34621 RepID=UPI003F5BDBD6